MINKNNWPFWLLLVVPIFTVAESIGGNHQSLWSWTPTVLLLILCPLGIWRAGKSKRRKAPSDSNGAN